MDDRARMLIVDDDESICRILEFIFRKQGYEIEVVGTGQEAIDRARTTFFDLALLDLRLPDVAGVELLEPLKEIQPDIALLIITGYASTETAVQALNNGASGYITKPFDMDEVLAKVRDVLEKQRLIEQKRQAEQALEESEERYRGLFEKVPISLLEEDFSAVKAYINELRAQGIHNIEEFFESHPEAVAHCATLARVLDVNEATLGLFEAEGKDDLIGPLDHVFGAASCPGFKEELIALVEGRVQFSTEMIHRTLTGKDIHVNLNLSVAPGAEQTWSRILLSLSDITEHRRVEKEIRSRNRELVLLNRVIAAATSTLESDQVLQVVCQELAQALEFRRAVAGLLNAEGTEISYVAEYPTPGRPRSTARTIPIVDDPATQYVLENQAPLAAPYAPTDERLAALRESMHVDDTHSLLVLPIPVARGRIAGTIRLDAIELRGFSQEEIALASSVAAAAGQALETARLYQALRRQAEQLQETVALRTAELQLQNARLQAILHSVAHGIIVTNGQGEIIQVNPVADAWLNRTLPPKDAAQLAQTVRDMVQSVDKRPETVLELDGLDLQLNVAPIATPAAGGAEVVVAVYDISHLKALDRMKSRFVSHVSHELRTPITTLKLHLNLLQRNPESLERYLNLMEQEADQLAQLVESILQLSHIDVGRLEVKLRQISLNGLTETAVANHLALAQDHGLALEHLPAASELVAIVDPDRIMQVMSNLFSNAIRYTPVGGRIEVSIGQEKADGQTWATVTVADTGIGISQEELPYIFERFFRGEAPQGMQIQGTGLGLAILKEIVDLHGGRVTVQSEVDVGSTFCVWLPSPE